jgi:hypothetical protein
MRGVGLLPSGLSATTTTLLPVLKAGDHLLVTGNYRTAIKRAPGGATLRRHTGLENVDDLEADLGLCCVEGQRVRRNFAERSAPHVRRQCGCSGVLLCVRLNGPPSHKYIPGFLRGIADNHPFTMTTIPAVHSSK